MGGTHDMTPEELDALTEEIHKAAGKVTYSVAEAAEAMGVSRPTMQNLINTAGFPAYKVGQRIFVDAAGLREWSARMARERAGY